MTTEQKGEQVDVSNAAHLDGIDGLRGLAALLVVIFHLYLHDGEPQYRPWHHFNVLRPVQDFWCGVNLFLVLSGFCLFWPYARNNQRSFIAVDFMWRRIRRIIPAYYASMVAVPILSFLIFRKVNTLLDTDHRPHDVLSGVEDYTAHIFFLHTYFPSTLYSLNGVYWTLGLEWAWYLVFPLCVLLYKARGAIVGLLVLAAISLAYGFVLKALLGPWGALHTHWFSGSTLWCFLAGRIFEFGVGMFVAWLLANYGMSKVTISLCLVLFPLMLLAAHQAERFDPFIQINNMLFGVAFASLLVAVASPIRNIARNVFSSGSLRAVGEFSYSLYLFHMPIIWAIYAVFHLKSDRTSHTFFLSLLLLPVILVISKLAYLAFEKPFMSASTKKQYTQVSPQEQPAA